MSDYRDKLKLALQPAPRPAPARPDKTTASPAITAKEKTEAPPAIPVPLLPVGFGTNLVQPSSAPKPGAPPTPAGTPLVPPGLAEQARATVHPFQPTKFATVAQQLALANGGRATGLATQSVAAADTEPPSAHSALPSEHGRGGSATSPRGTTRSAKTHPGTGPSTPSLPTYPIAAAAHLALKLASAGPSATPHTRRPLSSTDAPPRVETDRFDLSGTRRPTQGGEILSNEADRRPQSNRRQPPNVRRIDPIADAHSKHPPKQWNSAAGRITYAFAYLTQALNPDPANPLKRLKPFQIAAIIGNLAIESRSPKTGELLVPGIHEENGEGFGIAQWTPDDTVEIDRLDVLTRFAKYHRLSRANYGLELAYVALEINSGGRISVATQSGETIKPYFLKDQYLIQNLYTKSTIEDATRLIMDQYEAPESSSSFGQRLQTAREVLAMSTRKQKNR